MKTNTVMQGLFNYLHHNVKISTPDGIAKLVGIPDIMGDTNRINVHFGGTAVHTKNSIDGGYDKRRNHGAYNINTEHYVPVDAAKAEKPLFSMPGGCRPILRPMSHITQEIIHDNCYFTPAHRLFELACGGHWNDDFNQMKVKHSQIILSDCTQQLIFHTGELWFTSKGIAPDGESEWNPPFNQKALFNFLYSIHIDLDGMIEKGNAVSYDDVYPESIKPIK